MSTEAIQQIAEVAKIAAPIGQGMSDQATANYNADVLHTQAGYALAAASAEEARMRRNSRAAIGQQVANQAANGVGFDSSSADVIRQNEVNAIADALAVRHRGQIEAAGFESRAAMTRYEGQQAFLSGIQSAGTELLMSAADKRAQQRQLDKAEAARKARALGVQ